MIRNPDTIGAFEFAVVSGLRAAQLMRGCTPRLTAPNKRIVIAQMEVAAGFVARSPVEAPLAPRTVS